MEVVVLGSVLDVLIAPILLTDKFNQKSFKFRFTGLLYSKVTNEILLRSVFELPDVTYVSSAYMENGSKEMDMGCD